MAAESRKNTDTGRSIELRSCPQSLITGAMLLPIAANYIIKQVKHNGNLIKHGQVISHLCHNLPDEERLANVPVSKDSKKGGDRGKRRYLRLVEKEMIRKPQLIVKGHSNLTVQVDDNYSIGLSTRHNRQGKEAYHVYAKRPPKN